MPWQSQQKPMASGPLTSHEDEWDPPPNPGTHEKNTSAPPAIAT